LHVDTSDFNIEEETLYAAADSALSWRSSGEGNQAATPAVGLVGYDTC
jgi:hypothetical protein